MDDNIEMSDVQILEKSPLDKVLEKLFPNKIDDLLTVTNINEEEFKAVLSIYAVKDFLEDKEPLEFIKKVPTLSLKLRLSLNGKSRKEILELYKSTEAVEEHTSDTSILKRLI